MVSVIVATYNWSSALYCALTSVQAQTFQDFEVLIVGDCCTDDSADVVQSFHDPRMSWHNLEKNYGSQWGPNNFALRKARGTWIAYLGHDDIWHPDHLRTLVETASSAGTTSAVAVMIMYGPPSSGVRSIAGLYANGYMSVRDFVPPSGLLHRRDAVDRIGLWTDANLCTLPTDCEFQTRLFTLGPIVSTCQLTVFKFNSASRRESYIRRDVSEQQAMLHKIVEHPDFRHHELIDLFATSLRQKLLFIRMPDSKKGSPGEIHRKNRLFRGLDRPFHPSEIVRSDEPVRFSLERTEGCHEWHQLERNAIVGSFRWSGPSTLSTLYLPLTIDRHVTLRFCIIDAIDDKLLDTLDLLINDNPTAYTLSTSRDFPRFVCVKVDKQKTDYTKITVEVAKTEQRETYKTKGDHRWLGIAVAWVEVAPTRASESVTVSTDG